MIHDLNKLGHEDFEKLAQALVQKIISPSAKIYGRGRDGGRDAVYTGTALYPSPVEKWDGHWIFQAKFHDIGRLGQDPARDALLKEIETELEKIIVKNSLPCDNYIMITNVSLTSTLGSGTRDILEGLFNKLKPKYKIKNIDIWSASEIETFLINYPEITKSFYELRQPLDIANEIVVGLNKNQLEVSYTVIDLNGKPAVEVYELLSKLLNVQNQINRQEIPFIIPERLEHLYENSLLFLHGRSGIGKSRTLHEVTKKLMNEKKTIYVINPYSVSNSYIRYEGLWSILSRIGPDDVLVWDNFPNGLLQRNPETGRSSLDLIGSRKVNAIISLSPLFPENYVNFVEMIPDIHIHKIEFSSREIKQLIEAYGLKLNPFREIYKNHIEQNLEQISEILWKKEPSPLLVLEYYKQVLNTSNKLSDPSQAIKIAENLETPGEYFVKQFKYLKKSSENKNDIHFLYTLKFCYQLGISRELSRLDTIQKNLFGTTYPLEPLQTLDSWIYLSGQYYSLHDLALESIELTRDILLKIIQYLTKEPTIMMDSDDSLYLGGVFVGTHVQYLLPVNEEIFLPPSFDILMKGVISLKEKTIEMVNYCNKNNITMHDPEFAKMMADFVNNNRRDYFGLGLGKGLAQFLVSSDENTRSKNWKKLCEFIDPYYEISYGFGQQIGNVFKSVRSIEKAEIWDRLVDLCKINGGFASGLGESMSNLIEFLNEDDLNQIEMVSFNNPEFLPNFSLHLMIRIQSYETVYLKDHLTYLLNNNPKFANLFNNMFKREYDSLDKEDQTQIANELETHDMITIIRIYDIVCDFCGELVSTQGYSEHMKKNHSEILDEIIQEQGEYEKCKYCDEVVKIDFNDLIRHAGDKHYDTLPAKLKDRKSVV